MFFRDAPFLLSAFRRLPPSVRRHSAAVSAVVGQWRQALGLWEARFAAFAAVGFCKSTEVTGNEPVNHGGGGCCC